jgi:hypothetical protein
MASEIPVATVRLFDGMTGAAVGVRPPDYGLS